MGELEALAKVSGDWKIEGMREPWARRHAHVHAQGLVNEQYIATSGKGGGKSKIGEKLDITSEYFKEFLDHLAQVALVVSQAAVFTIFSSKSAEGAAWDEFDSKIIENSFDLLVAGRHRPLEKIFENTEKYLKFGSSREHVRANSLCARKNLSLSDGGDSLKSIKRDIAAWDVSVASRSMVLAKYCLMEAWDDAEEVFENMQNNGEISMFQLATWPILEGLREHMEIDDSEIDAHASH